jgi:hypothetical protein
MNGHQCFEINGVHLPRELVLLSMIAERKLSISFSKYIVQVIDPTNGNISYIEYISAPQSGLAAHPVKVFESKEGALMSALTNCYNRVMPDAAQKDGWAGLVVTLEDSK